MGKSSDMATVALNCLLEVLATTFLPSSGGLPGREELYSAHETPELGDEGVRDKG